MNFLLIDGDETRLELCRDVAFRKLCRENSKTYSCNIDNSITNHFRTLANERIKHLQISKSIREKFEKGEIIGSMV